jgi:hypothetical protein
MTDSATVEQPATTSPAPAMSANEQDVRLLLDLFARITPEQMTEAQRLWEDRKAEAARQAVVEAAQALAQARKVLLDFVSDELRPYDMEKLGWVSKDYADQLREEIDRLKARKVLKEQTPDSGTAKPASKTKAKPASKTKAKGGATSKKAAVNKEDPRDKGGDVYLSEKELKEQEVLRAKQKGHELVLKKDSSITFKTGRANKLGCFPDNTMDRRLWKIK